jgi:hypothetical protein
MTITTAVRRTYNAAMTRIFAQHQIQTVQTTTTAATRVPFRPKPAHPSNASTTPTSDAAQDPSSITGLRFCLHMVLFSTPGIFLAKKLSDGERLPDIVQHYKETITSFVDTFR